MTHAAGLACNDYDDASLGNENLMPTGEGYLGGGAFLRSRDLLKIGQAYLDGGSWNGERIVTAEWVQRSTAPAVPNGGNYRQGGIWLRWPDQLLADTSFQVWVS